MREFNDLSFKVRGACYTVHNSLGPGLLESVYHRALLYELGTRGLTTESEIPLSVYYKGIDIGVGYRIDKMVEGILIVELKSVEVLSPVHYKQMVTYLKLSKKPLGLLVNFNALSLDKHNLKRIINY
jgi:GxxExxY protein